MSFGPFPYLHFMWVSPPLEKKIKDSSMAGGLVSIFAALVLGIVVLFLDGDLGFVRLFQGCCAFLLLMVGCYLAAGRSCISSGYLNLTIAAQVRRPLLALLIFQAVLLLLPCLMLLMHLTVSTEASTVSLVVSALLQIPLFGLPLMNYLVARKLLPPRPEVLRRYGLSGQVLSPSFQAGPPQAWPHWQR